MLLSLPVRGAWIEMQYTWEHLAETLSRSPCGERGLKCHSAASFVPRGGRSPCGERGLKFPREVVRLQGQRSLPVRGAWIEMPPCGRRCAAPKSRSPCGERGLKCLITQCPFDRFFCRSPCGERGLKSTCNTDKKERLITSLPVRGAWIEIPDPFLPSGAAPVAPRAGSVD